MTLRIEGLLIIMNSNRIANKDYLSIISIDNQINLKDLIHLILKYCLKWPREPNHKILNFKQPNIEF